MEKPSISFDALLRILVVGALVFWSLWIISPFILPFIWAVVVAVAVYPMYRRFEPLFGKRKKLAAIVFTALMIAIMIYPIWAVSGSLIEYTQNLAAILEDGSIQIPPPSENIKSWPVIGHKIYNLWAESSQSLSKTLEHYETQVISLSSALLQGVASFGFTMLQFLFAVIISGVLLANRERGIDNAKNLMHKLVGSKDVDFLPIIGGTIRSVSQGVIGIAVIQAVLAYLGFWLAGVPGASFWALGVLVLAIVQLPPTLVILPIIIYVFYTSSTTVGVVFCIYSIAVSISDSFLKPVFLGRGVDVPMLVILIGSLGGMFAFGIIGLFIGPIILAITYKLYLSWLKASKG